MEMVHSKWIATVASLWIQCSSGSLYTFGIFSSALKSSQGYDQSTLDTVSVFKDIGANAGVLSGFFYSAVAVPQGSGRRRSSSSCFFGGPWLVIAAGAMQSFAGYFLLWLAVVGFISRPPVPFTCCFMFLAAHAQTFFNTADVVTAVHNFPDFSGTAVGIMKGFLGLSGAILIQIYGTIFEGKPASFLLMLAIVATLNPLLLMCLVRIHNGKQGDEKKHLNRVSVVALVVAGYLMILIILENILTLQFPARVLTLVVLLVLLASPLAVAIKADGRDFHGTSQRSFIEDGQLMDDADKSGAQKIHTAGYHLVPDDAEQGRISDDNKVLLQGENLNLLQAVCTYSFWCLFLAMACGMGSGLATVNNISQIGGSLGYMSLETSTLVSLWSIWNFLGRFGTGYVSDYFLHARGWARPVFMVITLGTMSIGHFVIASGLPRALYAGSVLVGVCYGAQWSLMPTITCEIFGVRQMGTIFNAIAIASPVGSYIFSVRVVGYLYDKEASAEGNTCSGTHCFRLSFLIMASATLLGSFVALILFFRTKNFYNQVVIPRLQHSARV